MSSQPAAAVESRRERTLARVLAAVLVLLFLVSSAAWALVDTLPPRWDQARHALDALLFLKALREAVSLQINPADLLVWHDNYYVYLGYLPTALAHAVFGTSWMVAKLVMVGFWTPLALGSTWWLVRQVLGRDVEALVGLAFLASAPLVADFAKDYLVDFPILALVALSMALLVRSDFLLLPRWSAAFGAAAGCIILVKALAPGVFLVVPVLAAVVQAVRTGTVKQRFRGAVLAGVAFFLVAGPVHVKSWSEFMMARQWQTEHAAVEGDPTAFWPSLLVHVQFLVDYHARGFLLAWLLLGSWALWKTHKHVVAWCWGAFLFSELVWTWYPNKDVRFCFPNLVYLSVPAAGLLMALKREETRRAGALGVFLVALFSLVSVQWNVPFLPQEVAVAPGWRVWAQKGYLRGAPDRSPDLPLAAARLVKEDVATHPWPHRPMLRFDESRDEAYFSYWGVQHASFIEGWVYEVEDNAGMDNQADYLAVVRCAGETFPDHPGMAELAALRTPEGCTARILRNDVLREQEGVLRTAGTALNIPYKADYMEQTLVSAHLDSTEVRPGEPHVALFLAHINLARRSRYLTRTLLLGDRPVGSIQTAETRYFTGGDYVHALPFTVPADVAPGEYPLRLRVEGPAGRAIRRDLPGDVDVLDVARLRVGPAAAP